MSRYQKSGTGKGRKRADIPALEKAGNDARIMQESPDENLSHIGRILHEITSEIIKTRGGQQADKEKGRFFYTSAEASAKDD